MIKKIFSATVIFALVCVSTYILLELAKNIANAMQYYEVRDRSISPDGKYRISEYQSSNEGGHTPYGVYLVLSSSEKKEMPESGYVVYAGYCINNLKYSWVNSNEIRILCELSSTAEPNFIGASAYGFKIVYTHQ